ncbi:MAG TPA: VOC family protein [Syntrophales bacterium]|nr:VOC family protein [Syntrophales bacterium]
MMIQGLEHIGIAVRSIDKTLEFLKETFGAEELARNEYPELQEISSTVHLSGTYFELIEPTGPKSVIGKFIENSGEGFHHISILCGDLEKFVGDLEEKGLKIVGKVFEGPYRIAFIHPKSSHGLLIELTDKGLPKE